MADGLHNKNTRRDNARRMDKDNADQEVPPKAPTQYLIDPLNENVTNVEFM